MDGHSETTDAGHAEACSRLSVVSELSLTGGIQDLGGEGLHHPGLRGIERRRAKLSVDSHVRGGAGLEVKVRSLHLV